MDEMFNNAVMLLSVLSILILFFTVLQLSFETSFNLLKKSNQDFSESGKKSFRFFGGRIYGLNKLYSAIIFMRYFLYVIVLTFFYPLLYSTMSFNIYILIFFTIVFILLVELLPELLAKNYSETMQRLAYPLVTLFYWVGFPLIKLVSMQTHFVNQYIQTSEKKTEILTKKNNIRELNKENQETGLIDLEDESNILDRIFKLGDVRVYEVMRPRTEIIGIEINSTIEETLNTFIESGYSKMPVFDDNLDNIKGFVSSYDLFKKPGSIKEILRNILFVPETKKCTDMLKEFSINKASFAIAVDEFGGTAGIVTMEDLIEELLGEIKDEFDTEEEICREIAANTFIVNGKAEIDFVNENFNMKFPKGEYSTVAGYITYFIGRIPKKGEIIKLDKFRFTIIKTTPTRIDLVKVVIAE